MICAKVRALIIVVAVTAGALISACAPRLQDVPERIDTYIVDFTPYMSQGFLITPEEYHGDYESMGYIEVYYHPASHVGTETKESPRNKTQTITVTVVSNEPVDMNRALKALYGAASKMGADAIMRFEMKAKVFVAEGRDHQGLILSGFAIKRKGAFE